MIYKARPREFNAKFEVVSCFVEYDGKILLLHRQDHKPQGNVWGVPAGKVDSGEKLDEALVREVKEETGLEFSLSDVVHFDSVFVTYPEYDFMYHIFHTKLSEKRNVLISEHEHKAFTWVTPDEALTFPLIKDEDLCIKLFYSL